MTSTTTEPQPYCESCGDHHAEDESHCPNCGQAASSGFHAAWNLDQCPIWINGRGWVPRADTTTEERKATWPDGPWSQREE
jgi:hypothetical protein